MSGKSKNERDVVLPSYNYHERTGSSSNSSASTSSSRALSPTSSTSSSILSQPPSYISLFSQKASETTHAALQSARRGQWSPFGVGVGGGATKRLFAAVFVGLVFVFGFSTLLPSAQNPFSSSSKVPNYASSPYPEGDDLSSNPYGSSSKHPHYAHHSDVPASHLYPLPIDASLEERLDAWRNAPGRGWEPADFVAWNLEVCGEKVVPNHNKDLIAKASLIWAVMNSSAILGHRERMARYLEDARDAGAWGSWTDPASLKYDDDDGSLVPGQKRGYIGKGRGMVFTAGNADTLKRVVWSLRLMRKYYNSTLPASIYHFPTEEPEADDPIRKDLSALGATLVAATSRSRDPTRTKNYHLKAQAILESPYAEVIYLDSDNLPALDPDRLFDEQSNYKRLGAMFWPDYWKTSASNPIWAILGVQCRDEWEQEAGQILIDKRRHLDVLLLSAYMLQDWQFWYYFSDGDKDIFRFAMLALRKRWALPGRWVGAGGLPSGTASGEFCSHTMQQYDNEGRPAFVHYNLLKQIPSGVGKGFSWGRTKQVRDLPPGGDKFDPPVMLRPSTRYEFEHSTDPVLEKTERWWKPDSRANREEARYKAYPYPDADSRSLRASPGGERLRGADDVEADMLANAADDGRGIQPATEEVRRRAAVERGLRPFFHGGVVSALCIDIRFEDPYGKPREANTIETPDGKAAPNELGIDWGISPLEVAQWTMDDRLRDLEENVYAEGFVPNGKGF